MKKCKKCGSDYIKKVDVYAKTKEEGEPAAKMNNGEHPYFQCVDCGAKYEIKT